jgi:hypothetical protein
MSGNKSDLFAGQTRAEIDSKLDYYGNFLSAYQTSVNLLGRFASDFDLASARTLKFAGSVLNYVGMPLDYARYQNVGYSAPVSFGLTGAQYATQAVSDVVVGAIGTFVTPFTGPAAPAMPYATIAAASGANYKIGNWYHDTFNDAKPVKKISGSSQE